MPKNQHTIPPARRLRLQKVQRGRRKQDGVYKTTYLAKVDGRVKVQGAGLFWVHDPAGTDNNGNTIYGAERKMPMLSGAVIDPRPNLKVDVVTIRGVDYIARMNKVELDRMGYDAHQTNILDPQRKPMIEHLINFQAFSTPGVATVQVTGSIFRKSDGTYGVFPNTGGYDLITGNTPSADMQVVICQWFDTDAEDVVVTVSSEISRDIDLTAPVNIATRVGLINECAALAPANSIGITAWQIYDDTTSITNNNKLDDLRGIVGTGHGSVDVHANTLVLNDGSELTIASDIITVTKTRHIVDTEANAASDDLDTVNGLAANEVCVITAADTTRTVVIKHGVDNIVSVTGADISLDDNIKAVLLMGSIDGTEVWAYPLFSNTISDAADVTYTPADNTDWTGSADPGNVDDALDQLAQRQTDFPSATATLTNKTISASANTLIIGAGVSKTIDGSDTVAAGTDRNLIISANSGTSDLLREVTGLSVGESVYLRAASGHSILVSHSHSSATIKIYLLHNANIFLDELNPLKLTLVDTNVLAETASSSGDVFGPSTNINFDNTIVLFDGISGKLIKSSFVPIVNGVLTGSVSVSSGVIKTLSSDAIAVGNDRNILVAAQTGTSDNLIQVTGLTVGESVLLRADAGDTITVKHNDAGATVKIHLHGNADITLDEQNPLRLTLIATNVLSEDVQGSGGVTASSTTTFTNKTIDADGTGNVITNIGAAEVKADLITGQTDDSAPDIGADYLLIYDASAAALKKIMMSRLFKFAILRDEKTSGTASGGSTASTWNNRNLNTETYDPDGIVSISSNQFTPLPGTYILHAVAAAGSGAATMAHRLRLFNVTGAASVEEGLGTQSATQARSPTLLKCSFTANGTDAYRIDHYTSVTQATTGLGVAVSDGSAEVFLEIILQKVA